MSTRRTSPLWSRRDLLGTAALLPGVAASSRAEAAVATARAEHQLATSHHPATARAVIWLYMEGGPSAADTFDPKPALTRYHGQRTKTAIDVFFGSPGPLMRSPFAFKQHGQSGAWASELFPEVARHVDELCFLRSCVAGTPNHGPAMYQMNTGYQRPGFPSAGAWILRGLGSENTDLPGFVVLPNARGSKGGPANWGNGFLPTELQGTALRPGRQPILNLDRAASQSDEEQRATLDLTLALDRAYAGRRSGAAPVAARDASLSLAYRMQAAGREVAALDAEPAHIKKLYGLDRDVTRPFGEKCLLARRLVERGVRFVQVYCDDEWDSHSGLRAQHGARAAETDRPVAALLADLKQRGLLDTTLVIWGGEFGRMPVSEQGDGRDHNPHGFLVWLAGGGVKGGVSHGATDELGYKAAVDPVSVHDLHATMLHTLGLDHRRLTYFHNGRQFRLTDVEGEVLRTILKAG
jgi:hypothetical protein